LQPLPKVNLFIGWSGETSRKLAIALDDWIQDVIQAVKPWISEDLGPGIWPHKLEDSLKETKFGIFCLTKENRDAPWMHYEAGFLAREVPVYPYLLNLEPVEIKGPFSYMQMLHANKEGTLKLLFAINEVIGGPHAISRERLTKVFDVFWPKLNEMLGELQKVPVALLGNPLPSKVEALAKENIESLSAVKRIEEALVESPGRASRPQRQPEPKPRRSRAATFQIEVINPSRNSRRGPVAISWHQVFEMTRILPQELVVRDEAGHELPFQVDPVVPNDPSCAVLLFSLDQEIKGRLEENSSSSYLITLEKRRLSPTAPTAPPAGDKKSRNKERPVPLINSKLEILLELAPAPWHNESSGYAGSVSSVKLDTGSSVKLDKKEILGMFKVAKSDYKERCMQVDQLFYPDGTPITSKSELIKQPYHLISQSTGPVQDSVTIASAPFDYDYLNPHTQEHISLRCQLYRVIRLYKDANYVLEELELIGVPVAGNREKDRVSLPFGARYFSYVDFGLEHYRLSSFSEGQIICAAWFPYQAYGFAANQPLHRFQNPHQESDRNGDEDNTFSWLVGCNKGIKCLHLFTYGENQGLQAQVENAWYETISEPLFARLIRQGKTSKRAHFRA
jgi:hypothetical protein